MSTKFMTDLRWGQQYEMKALKFIEHDEYIRNNDSRYDFLITHKGKQYKYEIKADRNSFNKGTILIEYEYRNKPSGITSSQADYFIYVSAFIGVENYYKIPTNELKEIVKDCETIIGGDNNYSKMYVVPIPKIANYLINSPIKGYDYYITGTMTETAPTTEEVKTPVPYLERLQSFLTDSKKFSTEELDKICVAFQEFSKQETEKKQAERQIITFGKYKFKTVKEVMVFDKKYLEWFIKQSYSDKYPALKDEIKLLLKV